MSGRLYTRARGSCPESYLFVRFRLRKRLVKVREGLLFWSNTEKTNASCLVLQVSVEIFTVLSLIIKII